MKSSLGSHSCRRRPSRIAAGPGYEALALAEIGRRSHGIPEYPRAADLFFGDGLEDDVGEFDCLWGDHDIRTDTASQVPGVDKEVQGRKAQTIGDGAPTDWRFHHCGKVDICNRLTSGSYKRVPPGERISHDIATWWIAGRPLWLRPDEKFGTEPDGCSDMTENIKRRPPRAWR